MGTETRKVGHRGQITIPKELRERFGIHGGDEVLVHEESGKIVIEKSTMEERLAEGYRRRGRVNREIEAEMAGVSSEADDRLGDAPEW
ncbi:MAG: AbrB/MazE/SpoVT family DNA-binding domain-containing protein [archaeon]